ncbi:MAG: biotin-dependent carboxyltransferase [Chitinophagaceae bacterium]|nr:biotin-dependent carboxyltransferase [Chitinophagaceae bacterium]
MKQELIHIEQCGFLSTIQDEGRKGYLQYGVAKGGAMDNYSMQLANLLTGNEFNAPVLEITQSPHQFQFVTDALVAFAGGGLQPVVNEKELPLFQCLLIPKGTMIELKKQIPGFRLYMAVAGGFEAELFLNSSSTNLLVQAGGFKGRPLKKGDTLHQQQPLTSFQKNLMKVLQSGTELQFNFNNNYIQQPTIRVIKGAEWNDLTHVSQQQLFQSPFSITPQSSRMGIRLKGAAITTNRPCDIISSPVTQGTVQLTSSGELIILMADAQTVGGYPRILQVAASDLRVLAQKKPGDAIQFQLVSLREAEEALIHQMKTLQMMKETIQK